MSKKPIAFYCFHDKEETVARMPFFYGLLSADEKMRMESLRFKWQQTEFLINRALVRVSLSKHDKVTDPRDWRFTYVPEGRPFVLSPRKDLYFSLSHTRGLSVCLVASFSEIGMDVESTEEMKDVDSIARHFFSPQENIQIKTSKDPDQAFYKFWTLKEAYLKAQSIGITVPLDSFHFELEIDNIRLFDPKAYADWSFFTKDLIGYQFALALKGKCEKSPDLKEIRFEEKCAKSKYDTSKFMSIF